MDFLRGIVLIAVLLLATIGVAAPENLRLMTWNIWHGGRENDHFRGPRQVIDLIQKSRADVVMMQETYGSGEIIARGLKFHFQPRGTNLSLHSRYPIEEDISVFEPFKCVGAIIRLPNGRRVAIYNIWLPYAEDIWLPEIRSKSDLNRLLAGCAPSARDLEKILRLIKERLADPKYKDIPLVIGGDFNSMSHLDYAEVARENYGVHVQWPTSQLMTDSGFRDTFRELNPDVNRAKDRTWSPRFPEQEQDRIDFIYTKGQDFEPVRTERIDTAPGLFPSDHAALLVEMSLAPKPLTKQTKLRAATYNIRHGKGMDDKLDFDRSTAAIRALKADIIALQEVDDRTKRCGGLNQVAELGRRLNMHPAYGSFMSYDGGWYGLALLSRYPLVNVRPLRLPDGNEPRVALIVDIRLPNGEVVTAVNVHFDWVQNDGFRFAQATMVRDAVAKLPHPAILMGDFNDLPGSRTMNLFTSAFTEVAKGAFTFPASEPVKEIDYIFVTPSSRWKFGRAKVVTEKLASDHRPVVTDLTLLNSTKPEKLAYYRN